jgi:tRNA pseudouridine55 synthase
MDSFVGITYEQTPPLFSAKKINGTRASELARKGETVELKPVPVFVRKFTCTAYESNLIHFKVECSKGTYVRVLAEDLAKKLGTVAHTQKLCRTEIGLFSVKNAFTLEQIEAQQNPMETLVLDLNQSTSFLEKFEVTPTESLELRKGKVSNIIARLSNSGLKPNIYCAFAKHEDKHFPIGLFELRKDKSSSFLRRLSNAVPL